MPLDLSKVLFVCTANSLDTIPAPLLDRMEVITLSGYVAEEKIAIALKYLAPVARTAAGLDDYNVILGEPAISKLIRSYCRESGVRNLKKHIDKVYRKAAFQVVKLDHQKKPDGDSITISPDNLTNFVGSPIFNSDRMYESTPPGVIMGLAWTNMGTAIPNIRRIIIVY